MPRTSLVMSIKRRMAGEASAMERTAMPSEREMGGEMGTAATSAVAVSYTHLTLPTNSLV